MKVKVYLTLDALERIALGQTLYSWHFGATNEDARKDVHFLTEIEVTLPSPAECVGPVLSKLAAKEDEIQAAAYEELKEIKKRRNDLMLIGCTPVLEARESEL